MDLQLQSKTALVTGASKGIGEAIARTLSAEGVEVHVAARSADALERLVGELPTRAVSHPIDLSVRGSATRLAEECGDVDIVVNNAGAVPGGRLTDVSEEAMREGYDLKLFGYVNLTREFLPAMFERGHGVILNVIGTGGERPMAKYAAGSVSNAGLMAFTRAIGGESPDHGVRVLAVNPGPVATDRIKEIGTAWAIAQGRDPDDWQGTLGKLPFGRICQPEEVADLVAFLVSPRAAYISGTVVTIDGGQVSA